jgi:hypothetical protein
MATFIFGYFDEVVEEIPRHCLRFPKPGNYVLKEQESNDPISHGYFLVHPC